MRQSVSSAHDKRLYFRCIFDVCQEKGAGQYLLPRPPCLSLDMSEFQRNRTVNTDFCTKPKNNKRIPALKISNKNKMRNFYQIKTAKFN